MENKEKVRKYMENQWERRKRKENGKWKEQLSKPNNQKKIKKHQQQNLSPREMVPGLRYHHCSTCKIVGTKILEVNPGLGKVVQQNFGMTNYRKIC